MVPPFRCGRISAWHISERFFVFSIYWRPWAHRGGGNTWCGLKERHGNRWLDAAARGPLFLSFFRPVLAPGPNDSNLGVSESSNSSLAGLLSGLRAEGYSSLWLTPTRPERRRAASTTTPADAVRAKPSPGDWLTCTQTHFLKQLQVCSAIG